MTKASFTDTQPTASTPLARSAAALVLKLGTCWAEQVGVNAPGTPNSTTFLPWHSASVVTAAPPLSSITSKLADGSRSPTSMVISISLSRRLVCPDRRRTPPFCALQYSAGSARAQRPRRNAALLE